MPLLHLLGIACGAGQMARLALTADTRREADADYLQGLIELARFYMATQAGPMGIPCARLGRC